LLVKILKLLNYFEVTVEQY